MIDVTLGKRIIALRDRVVARFDQGNWRELGLLTGTTNIIEGHDRLLRSLSWGDDDYAGSALSVLTTIAEKDSRNLGFIDEYLSHQFPGEGQYVSAKPSDRKITFAPHVFQVPEGGIEADLVAVMMPFDAAFRSTYDAIKSACATSGHRCLRVDDIWEESAIIQDIFALTFRAHIVIVDFTGKNPNVMYETGIAHTLGKHVVPISQSLDDIPFDMKHHRVLRYLGNTEGRATLTAELSKKLLQLGGGSIPDKFDYASSDSGDDDIPF